MSILYNLLILPLMKLFFKIASLFNKKIKKGLIDRKRLFENLIIDFADIDRSKKVIWFHSASLGEFEQAKPVIEKIKSEVDVNIFVTFFSPSGYVNSVNYQFADIIAYVPFDSKITVKRFINIVRPDSVIFMRYDIWPNIIGYLNKQKIPIFLVDATMRQDSKRFSPVLKNFNARIFSSFSKILTVSEEDRQNFLKFNLDENKVITIGDTRFDRVQKKSLASKDRKLFKDEIFKGKNVFVLGSSWESDEEVVFPAIKKAIKYHPDLKIILVPHEPTLSHIEKIESDLNKEVSHIRFSNMNSYAEETVIIIDCIGILLALYKYANAAYVGGSFRQGIHNVLEPAVYGIPVVFGPKINNSQEAIKLIKIGGGKLIKNKKQFYKTLRKLFSDSEYSRKLGKLNYDFVKENTGATDRIFEELKSVFKHAN